MNCQSDEMSTNPKFTYIVIRVGRRNSGAALRNEVLLITGSANPGRANMGVDLFALRIFVTSSSSNAFNLHSFAQTKTGSRLAAARSFK